jgi:gamma-tubulin complex component 2
VWLTHQQLKELGNRGVMGATHTLRQRMLHFVQNFVYYIMFEVIRPQWRVMEEALKKVTTIDQVLEVHNEFLDSTLKETLLTNQDLLKILTKLMSTCLLFAEEMKAFNDSLELDSKFENVAVHERLQRLNLDPSDANAPNPDKVKKTNTPKMQQARYKARRERLGTLTEEVKRGLVADSYTQMVKRFAASFDSLLASFMQKLFADAHSQYHSHLTNLCTRLDYNGFWSSKSAAEGGAGRADGYGENFARASLGL